jgi:hypothetical protein
MKAIQILRKGQAILDRYQSDWTLKIVGTFSEDVYEGMHLLYRCSSGDQIILKGYGNAKRRNYKPESQSVGLTNHFKKRIEILTDILRPPYNFQSVLLHEIAHSYFPAGAGHNQAWADKYRELARFEGLTSEIVEKGIKDGMIWWT